MLVILVAFIVLANYQYENMNPVTTNVFLLAIVMYSIVFLNAFILLIRKSFASQVQINTLKTEKLKQGKGHLLIRADRKTSKVTYEEIAYIESLGDYVKIVKTDDQIITTKEKIGVLSEKLPDSFYRIHRSFIVNGNVITSFSKESITINNESLPISRTYKKTVEQKLMSANHP
jgi:DNA-binding LytR/AlgR family response regulator